MKGHRDTRWGQSPKPDLFRERTVAPRPAPVTSHVSDYDALFERVVIPAPLEAGDRAAGSASRDNAFSRRHGLRGWQDASARADAPAEFS
jgi:hypothetical protein